MCVAVTLSHLVTRVQKNNLRSAVLMELASHYALGSDPPAFRKYSFLLVLAGHTYFQTKIQREHAVRCYASAAASYDGRGWKSIDDHVKTTLAGHCSEMGCGTACASRC